MQELCFLHPNVLIGLLAAKELHPKLHEPLLDFKGYSMSPF